MFNLFIVLFSRKKAYFYKKCFNAKLTITIFDIIELNISSYGKIANKSI